MRQTRKGIELPDILIARSGALRDHVDEYGATVVNEDAKAVIGDVADALGKLQLAILDAGASYPFDPVVELRAQAVSYTGLTAALVLGC